jgi:DNA-binding response OmpR family regulator
MSTDKQKENYMAKKVCICDDDEGILEVSKIILEEKGYEVYTSTDSEIMLAEIDRVMPNIIMLDLWMPTIGGDKLTEILKGKESTKNIPIIIVSASKDTEKVSRLSGADGFICKPFDIEELEQIVDRLATI